MKNIWLNILAFVAFLAIEITAVSFMSTYSARSAAMALLENSELSARSIVEKALKIAGDICIYTNHNVSIEEL